MLKTFLLNRQTISGCAIALMLLLIISLQGKTQGQVVFCFKDSVRVTIHDTSAIPHSIVNGIVVSNNSIANSIYNGFGIRSANMYCPSCITPSLREIYVLGCSGCNLVALKDSLNAHPPIFFGADTLPCAILTGMQEDRSLQGPPSVFPNPVEHSFYLENTHFIRELRLYTSAGRLLFTKQTDFDAIDISSQQPGLYLLAIVTRNKVYYRKLIKN